MIRSGATQTQRLLIHACLDNGVPFFWQSAGLLLIDRSGLDAIIQEVTVAGATVLGFEAFELESTDVHPRLDLIFDAEARPEIQDPLSAIEDWPPNVWVDVALRA